MRRVPLKTSSPAVPLHTHYENLKVARNAPLEVIRAAYRVLAQRYHPDVNPSADAARVMTLLNEAYAVLSDAKQRAAHDAWIEEQLIKEASDDATANTRQAAADARGEQQPAQSHASATAKTPTPAGKARIFFGAAVVVGLASVLGVQLTARTSTSQQPSGVSYQQPVADWVGERAWSEVERTSNFVHLSSGEKDSVREAYFERVMAPKVSPSEVASARAQFYRDSGHTRPPPSPPIVAAPPAEQSRKAPSYVPFNGKLDDPSGSRTAAAVLNERPAPRTFSFDDAQRASGQSQVATINPPKATATWSPNGKPWPTRAGYLDGFQQRATAGLSRLTIDNTSGGSDVYVKLCRASAVRCDGLRHIFIPLGASFAMSKITAGTYDIRYRSLDNGALAKSGPIEFVQVEEAEGTRYSTVRITLYRVAGGNATFESLPEDRF